MITMTEVPQFVPTPEEKKAADRKALQEMLQGWSRMAPEYTRKAQDVEEDMALINRVLG